MGPAKFCRSTKDSLRSDAYSFSGESRLKAVALPQLSGRVPALVKATSTIGAVGILIWQSNMTCVRFQQPTGILPSTFKTQVALMVAIAA